MRGFLKETTFSLFLVGCYGFYARRRKKSGAKTPPDKSIHPSVLQAELRCKLLSRSKTAIVAGSSPASLNSDSEGEALVSESPLSGSSSMNSSAAEAVIFHSTHPDIFTARCRLSHCKHLV